MSNNDPHPIEELLSVMQALRDPDTGCPWDQKQTFQTIVPYTIEESYEVADAISRADMEELRDELGDLLLQVVYHAQMADEIGEFCFTDVVRAICAKMIRRHPHVFSRDQTPATQDLSQEWERIKQQERAEKANSVTDDSALAHVAIGLAPLIRARKLQKKAAQVNFDWSDAAPVLDKISEELNELAQAVRANESKARLEEELGDVLFSVVNASRHLNVDAELALQKANSKFEARFRAMENLLQKQDKSLSELDEQQLDELWQQVKKSVEI